MATCYCKYSGVSFKVEGFTHKMEIVTIHPIFDLPLDRILQRSGDWAAGRMNENEERLFFLALLANTDLVTFRCTAEPSVKIIKENTEALIKFINWRKARGAATIDLPEVVIERETRFLSQVPTWLRIWNDAKDDWLKGKAHQDLRRKMQNSEHALERLIHSSFKSSKEEASFATKLGKWAIEVASVPDRYKEQWLRIFQLKGYELYGADWYVQEDIEMCLDHMVTHLDIYNSSLHTNTVLNHLRIILAKHKAGFAYFLGISNNEYLDNASLENELDSAANAVTSNPQFRIINQDDIILDRTKQMMYSTYAPKDGSKPKREDYPNTVAFMRALAAWNLGQKE